jgi:hypothetical protein
MTILIIITPTGQRVRLRFRACNRLCLLAFKKPGDKGFDFRRHARFGKRQPDAPAGAGEMLAFGQFYGSSDFLGLLRRRG